MSWGEPLWLWGVLVWGIVVGWQFLRKTVERVAASGSRIVVLGGNESPKRRGISFWIGIFFVIVALARPQWGNQEEPVMEQSREVLLALDLSRSMLAEDVSPSRLERSKLLIQDLLTSLQGERVGLLLFAGTAFVQSPLSTDYEILRDFLPHLNPDYLPQAGTDYKRLLEETLTAFGDTEGTGDRFLIILSDGESTVEGWESLADKLAAKGIRVIGLGVGTAAGAVMAEKGGGLIKDEKGAVVLSTLNSQTLEALAKKTDGLYRDASQWVDLAALMEKTVEEGRKGKVVEQKQVRRVERFQWVLIPGILALLISLWREFPIQLSRRHAEEIARSFQKVVAFLFFVGMGLQAAPPSEPPSALVSTVAKLSRRNHVAPQEWAGLAQETIQEGQGGKLPKGSIEDALEGVDRGEKGAPQAANWPELRKALEALLKEQEQKDQDSKDQNSDSKDQKDSSKDSKNQDSKGDKGENSKNQDSKGSPQDSKPSNSENSPQQPPEQKPEEKGAENSKEGAKPPEPQKSAAEKAKEKAKDEKQRVGGAKPQGAAERGDFKQAEALRQMKQVKEGDDPAMLFQVLRGKQEPESTKGKTW